MRIAFIGAVQFSEHCLREILLRGGDVGAVFTLELEKAGRHSDFADLAPLAAAHGIPCHRTANINAPRMLEAMRAMRPDYIFVFGWSQLIGPELRAIAPCIGTHPALLPENRGRHPIIWALVHGLERSGLTFFYLDEGADSGDILWQRPFEIGPEDDAGTLLRTIEDLASNAIAEFLPELASGSAPRIPQDHRRANYWPKRSARDGEIHWEHPSVEIHNLIRALARPYPGAHTFLGPERVTLWKSRLMPGPSHGAPGELLERTAGGGYLIATGQGLLELLEWEGGNLHAGLRLSSLLQPIS